MKKNYRMRTKICGITNVADAAAAAAAGADAIGLVFFEASPRFVNVERAQQIAQALPPLVNCVGLFVNAAPSYIKKVLHHVALDTLQFHGDETETDCTLYDMPYIKAIRMKQGTNLLHHVEHYRTAKALLLDSYVKDRPGGTGQHFAWQKIAPQITKPIILAGGLNVENVNQAIATVCPYAVDVSSGVEQSPGKKDNNKIIQFISEAHHA